MINDHTGKQGTGFRLQVTGCRLLHLSTFIC